MKQIGLTGTGLDARPPARLPGQERLAGRPKGRAPARPSARPASVAVGEIPVGLEVAGVVARPVRPVETPAQGQAGVAVGTVAVVVEETIEP